MKQHLKLLARYRKSVTKNQGMFWKIFLLSFFSSITGALSSCTDGTKELSAKDFTVDIIQYPDDGSSNYNINVSLCWKITASQDILLSLSSDIGAGDYIKVYDGTSSGGTKLTEKTDKIGNTEMVLATSDSIFVEFTSDGTQDTTKDKGFTFRYITGSSTACNSTVTADASVKFVSSPNFPNKYSISQTCYVEVQSSQNIEFKMVFMDVEKGTSCKYDGLRLISSDGTTSDLFCGTQWSPSETFVSSAPGQIMLISDKFDPKYGYVFSYKAMSRGSSNISCGAACLFIGLFFTLISVVTMSDKSVL